MEYPNLRQPLYMHHELLGTATYKTVARYHIFYKTIARYYIFDQDWHIQHTMEFPYHKQPIHTDMKTW